LCGFFGCSTYYRIQKFDSNGSFLTAWGSAGSGDGQFNSPGGVAVEGGGSVYVDDAGNYRIQKFACQQGRTVGRVHDEIDASSVVRAREQTGQGRALRSTLHPSQTHRSAFIPATRPNVAKGLRPEEDVG